MPEMNVWFVETIIKVVFITYFASESPLKNNTEW